VRVINKDGKEILAAGDMQGDRDRLEDVPII
jgi:hypothetical protein